MTHLAADVEQLGYARTSTPAKAKKVKEEKRVKKEEEKKNKRLPKYNLELLPYTKKSRAKRCEECKKPFRNNYKLEVRYIVGHHCNRPFFNRLTGKMHPGTRNYYFCPNINCLAKVEPNVEGKMIKVDNVKKEISKEDIKEFQRKGIHINK